MPDRHPRARRQPPSLTDHILSHPAETALAAWWVVVGVLLLLAHLTPDAVVSPSIHALPTVLSLTIAATISTGGALVLLGITWPGKAVTTAWATERAGWVLGGAGWSAYLVSVATRMPESLVNTTLAATMVTAAILRVIALHYVERQVRADVEAADT